MTAPTAQTNFAEYLTSDYNPRRKHDWYANQRTDLKDKDAWKQRAKDQAATHGGRLSQFDHNKVALDSFVLVIGKRRFGKSTWAQYILSKLWYCFPRGGYVFAKTKHNYFWQKHFPDNRIYEGFNAEVIAQIMEEQKNLYMRFIEGDLNQTEEVPFVCIILEDVISEKTLKYEQLLHELVFSGRHYFIFIMILSQDCKGLPPAIRQNADLIAATYQIQNRSIESICKDFADIFDDEDTFRQMLLETTQDFGMMIIDQTEAHYTADEVFFYDKADEEPEDFKVGDSQFWLESGCDWEEQLEKAKNVPTFKRADWEKVALKKLKEDLKNADYYRKEEEHRLLTNQPSLAPEKLRNLYKEEITKHFNKETNAVKEAEKLFNEKKYFKYIPPNKIAKKQYVTDRLNNVPPPLDVQRLLNSRHGIENVRGGSGLIGVGMLRSRGLLSDRGENHPFAPARGRGRGRGRR